MNWDTIKGNWNQIKGHVRKQWGELTDNEVAEMNGQKDILVGKIQERYGITKEEAARQVDDWASTVDSNV